MRQKADRRNIRLRRFNQLDNKQLVELIQKDTGKSLRNVEITEGFKELDTVLDRFPLAP